MVNMHAVTDNKTVQTEMISDVLKELKGSVKEPNMFHNYETEKITHKASDAAEYIKLCSSSARDHHAQRN